MRRLELTLFVVLLLAAAGCQPAGSSESHDGVTQTVGAQGGVVKFPGGTLSVPAGAVDQPTQLRVVTGGDLPTNSPLAGSWHSLSGGLQVDLEGREPAVPLELAWDTSSPSGVDPGKLFVASAPAEPGKSPSASSPSASGSSAGGRSSLLAATFADGLLKALLPQTGWFQGGWLDPQAFVQRHQQELQQLGQGFLELTKLRAPRPDCTGQPLSLANGTQISFDPAAGLDGVDPELWACVQPVPNDPGRVFVDVTNNRPLLWTAARLASGVSVENHDPMLEIANGHWYAPMMEALNKFPGFLSGPSLSPVSKMRLNVPVSVLNTHLTFVPDKAMIMLATLDFGVRELQALALGGADGAVTAADQVLSAVQCLSEQAHNIADWTDAALSSPGGLTTENLVFLGRTVQACWERFVKPGEAASGVIKLGSLLLSNGVAAMYNLVDPMVRLISGATYADVPVLNTTAKPVDWRNRTYQLSCDDIVSKPVDVTVHDGSATVNGAGLGSYDHWNVQVQAVQSGTVKGIADPVTVVLFTCSPQPSNFSRQEVQTFHPDGSYLARLRHLEPLTGGQQLTPVYDTAKLAVAGGEVVTGVSYYGPSDTHAGGPTVAATLRWHWDGHQFVPSGIPTSGGKASPQPQPAPTSSPQPQRPTQSPPQQGPTSSAPVITGVSLYQEDQLVYARVQYSDPDGDAIGFGFRGIKGAGWAQETHPFANPSYGRPSPGRIDYPFNLRCGTSSPVQSDIEFWISDAAGHQSTHTPIHLVCQGSAI